MAGLTVIVVSVEFTVTLVPLVAVSPPESVTVTRKLYVPALLNVAVVFNPVTDRKSVV